MRRFLFLPLLLLFTLTTHAQQPVTIKVIPPNSYLPSTVFYVYEDRDAFTWIATNSGVYRYDGYTFKHFTSGDGLGDNEILRIYQDKKGRIWFQSLNGYPSFYYHDSIFNASNNKMLEQLQFNKMILAECEDNSGNLYIASREYRYYKIDKNDHVEQRTYKGNENFIWCDHSGEPQFLKIIGYSSPRGSVYKDEILFGSGRKVYRVENDTTYLQQLELPEEARQIIFLKIKNENTVYIGTRNGLYVWDQHPDHTPLHFMQGYSVSSVAFDFEDNLWVSTLESGLFMIPSPDVKIYNATNGLPENKITCIESDPSGNLWIGMAKNNYSILDQQGHLRNFIMPVETKHDITNIRHFGNSTYITAKNSTMLLENNHIRSMQFYSNDILDIGGKEIFIAQDNTIAMTMDEFMHDLGPILNGPYEDRMKYQYVNARTNVLKCDQTGNVWIGTSRGLYTREQQLVNFSEKDPIFNSPVKDIAFDRTRQFVYVATLNGLLIIKDNQLFSVLNKNSGTPNSDCSALFVDAADNVWAAFGNELVQIKYTDGKFNMVNYSNRLKIECDRITDIDLTGNNLFIATENGLVYFDVNTPQPPAIKPILRFTDFRIEDSSYINSPSRSFSYRDNDVAIYYSALSYISHSDIVYEYQLDGYDKEWHSTSDRSIHYKSLRPGTYTFRIRAINRSGIESDMASLNFVINTPVWQKLWFRITVLLYIIGMIMFLWRRRLRLVKKEYDRRNKTIILEKEKAETERKLAELSQQAFRQQMNPHFIFNALNTIKGYYAENDVKQASEYISKFSKLLRTILESKDPVIPLEKEIHSIRLYLELAGMRYENKFGFQISVSDAIHPNEVAIPPMLLQPFIENSLIHGIAPKPGHGNITIHFYISGDNLMCDIIDDGVGRNASSTKSNMQEYSSKATQLITEYMQAMNSKDHSAAFTLEIVDLYNNEQQPAGTKVILKMPFMKIW